MSRTKHLKWDERTNRQGLSRCIKMASKQKRKRFKNLEINNGNYLDKCLANRWDWD